MPNWCENSLTIFGDKKTIENLYKMALDIDDKGFFNQIVPRPLSEEENWYNWNAENWGTKWDVCSDGFDVEKIEGDNDDYSFQIYLETAWSPPMAFVTALCKKFKVSATLDYIEVGCDFVGTLEVEKEKVLLDQCQPITRESLKYFGRDYDDYFFE